MEYTLMHKNISVLDIDLDEATSSVRKILATHHLEHLPLGTASKQGDADRAALNAWWIDRSIPASRSGIRPGLCSGDHTLRPVRAVHVAYRGLRQLW